MNKVVLVGRLTREPDVRYSNGSNPMSVAKFTLAVDRKYKKQGEQTADFINCIAFGKNGEFAEKYLSKGTKIVLEGHIQTGSYTNKDGNKVYTTDIIAESFEFAESKNFANANQNANENPFASNQASAQPQPTNANPFASNNSDDFMSIPDNIDEMMPFN